MLIISSFTSAFYMFQNTYNIIYYNSFFFLFLNGELIENYYFKVYYISKLIQISILFKV